MKKIYDYPVDYSKDDDIKSFYEKNGYVSIKKGISREDIKEITDDLTQIFSPLQLTLSNQLIRRLSIWINAINQNYMNCIRLRRNCTLLLK